MTRISRSRVAVTTGLTLGTATLGLAFAPMAMAALIAPTAPGTVVAGAEFTVTGTGCLTADPADPAVVALVTDSESDVLEEVIFAALPAVNGSWTAELSFPADTPAGPHEIVAACGTQYGTAAEVYPLIALTVSAPSTPAPPATPTTPSTPAAPVKGAVKGAAANTAGISATSSSVAASAVAPGRQITKVLKGFQPFEVVTLVMHSTPTTLGTFTADANGVVTATFTIPAGTAAADHTFVYDGSMGSYFQETVHVGSTSVSTASSDLAYTGASVGVPLALGAGLLVVGGGALVATRRRSAGTSQA